MSIAVLMAILLVSAVYFRRAVPTQSLASSTGFLAGMLYFTFVPIVLLFFMKSFPAVPGTAIPGVSWTRDDEIVITILFMTLLSIVGFMIVFDIFPRVALGKFDALFSAFSYNVPLGLLFTAYIVAAISLFFMTGLGAEQSHWAESKNQYMSEMGILGSVLMLVPATLRYIVLFRTLPNLFPLAARGAKFYWSVIAATLLCDLYTTGTRFFLFQFILIIVFDRLRIRDYRPVAIIAIAALPLGAVMEVYTVARTHFARWESRSFASAYEAMEKGILQAADRMQENEFYTHSAVNITESASLGIFKYVYSRYGNDRPYLLGTTLIKPFVAWIPRSWWPDKPANFTWLIGREVVREGVSVNSTSLGEFYGNFGILGGLLPAVVMLAYSWLFAILCRNGSVAYPYLCFVFGIAAARNGFMESALPLVICILALNVVGHDEQRPPYRTSKSPPR
jgi:hypothetical protein